MPHSSPVKKQWTFIPAQAIFGMTVCVGVLFLANELIKSSTSVDLHLEASQNVDEFGLVGIHRVGYDMISFFTGESLVNYDFLKELDAIIEPNVPNAFYFNSSSSIEYDYFRYYILGADNVEFASGKVFAGDEASSSFTIACNAFDMFEIQLKYYKDNSWLHTEEMTATCMYVRRELRSTNAEDISSALNAMHVMYTVDEETGQELYGENFHNIEWFAKVHFFNAAWKDGDHFHEGLGYLPQHIKLTNYFELSMQAVDPSVSLFYWDFTIESSQGLSPVDSPMFTADTFGSLNVPKKTMWTYTDDSILAGNIPNGRWANYKIFANAFSDSGLKNGFGFMRSPWSTNPSPYLTRFVAQSISLPSCQAYYDWLATDDMAEFLTNGEDDPHSAAHGSIGGVFGCDALLELTPNYLKLDAVNRVCSMYGFRLKEMYRNELISVSSEDCAVNSDLFGDADSFTCGFSCSEENTEMTIKFLSTFWADEVPEDMDSAGWMVWRDFICTGNGKNIFQGEQLQSSATIDPSFWPLHPSQEKTLQLRFMTGGFDEFTWPSNPLPVESTNYICNHQSCYNFDTYGGEQFAYESCCYGHYEFDQLFDFKDPARKTGFGMTNRELLDAVNPTGSYSVGYIYDSFTWSHCTDDQTDFDALVKSLIKKSSK